MAEQQVLTARWIFPVVAAPLERGTVTIEGTRIVAVEPHGRRTPDVDLGNTALIPGLVNAHTHLDLSGLRGRVPPGPAFIGWLKAIIAHRRTQTPEQIDRDIQTGLDEALRFGTTLIGDIAADGRSWPILAGASCSSVVFREIIGLSGPRVMPVWRQATEWLDEHPDRENCRGGLSPHAPYSVHQTLFRAAGNALVPLAIHLGETPEELLLIRDHDGPFVDFLREVGAWDESGLVPSLDWIAWRSERAPALLFAHGQYLDPAMTLPEHAAIVYCPRTHHAFGRGRHPVAELLARRRRVALGTDSLASNPDLDILAEARFLRQEHPEIPAGLVLRLATLSGAEALGFGASTGSLEAGKSADLVAIPLPDHAVTDPYALLFAENDRPRRTMWLGRWRT